MPALTRVQDGRVSRERPTTFIHDRPKGFVNPSMLCYRNSLLQCLLHTPVFYNALGAIHRQCKKDVNKCVTCALQELAYKYWHTSRKMPEFGSSVGIGSVVNNFHLAVTAECPDNHPFQQSLQQNVQGDPLELLDYLTERVYEKDDSVSPALDRLLRMSHIRRGTCQDCGAVTAEPRVDSQGLQLPIIDATTNAPTTKDLLGVIREVHNNELLQVSCQTESCREQGRIDRLLFGQDGLQTRHRVMRITQAPDMLCVALKRYDNWGRKIKQDVPFDPELDLTEFTEDGSELKYRLYSVVAHRGDDIQSGHYIAAVRNRDDQTISVADDTQVRTRRGRGFRDMQRPMTARRIEIPPYLLIYQRLEPEPAKEEEVDRDNQQDQGSKYPGSNGSADEPASSDGWFQGCLMQ